MNVIRLLKNKLIYEKEKFVTKCNHLHQHFVRQPQIISMDETIAAIKERKASIARYGDGEFDIIFHRTEGFQKESKSLSKRLREILKKNNLSDRFLVALPDCFGELSQFTPKAQKHWQIRLDKERYKWVKCLNTKYPYYNSQITRFYFDWQDKTKAPTWVAALKDVWDNQNILIVEGEFTRLGVNNDLFDNAKQIRRFLCPAENAYDKYDEILSTIKSLVSKDELIIMALGPTATVLAYDLFLEGFWAFDIGHVDIEYEWMKLQTTTKVSIPGKYVNEVANGNIVSDFINSEYKSQIVAKI